MLRRLAHAALALAVLLAPIPAEAWEGGWGDLDWASDLAAEDLRVRSLGVGEAASGVSGEISATKLDVTTIRANDGTTALTVSDSTGNLSAAAAADVVGALTAGTVASDASVAAGTSVTAATTLGADRAGFGCAAPADTGKVYATTGYYGSAGGVALIPGGFNATGASDVDGALTAGSVASDADVAAGSTVLLESTGGIVYATAIYSYGLGTFADDLRMATGKSIQWNSIDALTGDASANLTANVALDVVGALTAGTVASDASVAAGTSVTAATTLGADRAGLGTSAHASTGSMNFTGVLHDATAAAGYVLTIDNDADSGWYSDGSKGVAYHIDGGNKFSITSSLYGASGVDAYADWVQAYKGVQLDVSGTGTEAILYGSGAAGNSTWKLMSDNTSGSYDRVSLWLPASPASGASVEVVEYSTSIVSFKKNTSAPVVTASSYMQTPSAFIGTTGASLYFGGVGGTDTILIKTEQDGSSRYCELDFVFAADPATAPAVVGMTVTSAGVDVPLALTAGTIASDASVSAGTYSTAATYLAGLSVRTRTLEDHDGTDYLTAVGSAVTMPGALSVSNTVTSLNSLRAPYFRNNATNQDTAAMFYTNRAFNVIDAGSVPAIAVSTTGDDDGRSTVITATRELLGVQSTGTLTYGGTLGATDLWTFGEGVTIGGNTLVSGVLQVNGAATATSFNAYNGSADTNILFRAGYALSIEDAGSVPAIAVTTVGDDDARDVVLTFTKEVADVQSTDTITYDAGNDRFEVSDDWSVTGNILSSGYMQANTYLTTTMIARYGTGDLDIRFDAGYLLDFQDNGSVSALSISTTGDDDGRSTVITATRELADVQSTGTLTYGGTLGATDGWTFGEAVTVSGALSGTAISGSSYVVTPYNMAYSVTANGRNVMRNGYGWQFEDQTGSTARLTITTDSSGDPGGSSDVDVVLTAGCGSGNMVVTFDSGLNKIAADHNVVITGNVQATTGLYSSSGYGLGIGVVSNARNAISFADIGASFVQSDASEGDIQYDVDTTAFAFMQPSSGYANIVAEGVTAGETDSVPYSGGTTPEGTFWTTDGDPPTTDGALMGSGATAAADSVYVFKNGKFRTVTLAD